MSDPGEVAATPTRAGAYLATRLRTLDDRLAEVIPRLLGAAADEEAVHDLRVALRRIRTVLEVGRDVLGPFHADEVRAALRDVMKATGALRDEEVLRDVLSKLGVDRADVTSWLESRGRREARLRSALLARIRRGDVERGRQLLAAMLAFRVKPSRDRDLAKVARRAVERARKRVERRRGAAFDDVVALHELRIAYKRLRYTVETFSEALPGDVASMAPAAARFQGRLGDLHDVDVALACVRRARSVTDESRAELLAALCRLRAERLGAYARELGVARGRPPVQAVGTDALRKISSR